MDAAPGCEALKLFVVVLAPLRHLGAVPAMAEGSYCSLHCRIVSVWLVLVVICYNLFSVHDPDTAHIMYIPPSHLVDAIVFIAMGPMASDPMVDYSIASVRKIGKWTGEVYVVTDSPPCFADAVREYEIKTIEVPPAKSIIEIKSLKPRLLSVVPPHVNGVLYIDVDILITNNLASFFRDLGTMMYTRQLEMSRAQGLNKPAAPASVAAGAAVDNSVSNPSNTLDIDPIFDFAAFLDARGHFVGFCSGCEKWHSGVVWLRRGKGETCLKKWEETLLSGRFDTDQESLDSAEKEGACPHLLSFPTRHLLFAKDYIGMALTSGHTFIHLTAAGRPEDTDYFYREIVVPGVRNSLHPPLNPAKLLRRKVCAAKTIGEQQPAVGAVVATSTTVESAPHS